MKAEVNPACPISKVAHLLSDTWTMLIMHELMDGPKRFCDLESALPGISTRTHTLKLQRLTSEGMVDKTSSGAYYATKKGSGLQIIEKAMKKYSEQFLN